MSKQNPIGIKQLIDRVKRELLQDHDTSDPVFALGPVELEIGFIVMRDLQGGINLHVVEYDAEKQWTEVQKVKIRLDPVVTREDLVSELSDEERRTAKKAIKRTAVDLE